MQMRLMLLLGDVIIGNVSRCRHVTVTLLERHHPIAVVFGPKLKEAMALWIVLAALVVLCK